MRQCLTEPRHASAVRRTLDLSFLSIWKTTSTSPRSSLSPLAPGGISLRRGWTIPPTSYLTCSHSRATFFVLGWVAERQPKLIQAVAARGHEIAAHSYWHQRVTTMTRADFTADAIRTRELLEQILGADVSGFRAPSFSITPSNAWAFEALVEAGYRYDSSVFPIRRRGYGFPGAPRDAYTIQTASGALDEFPLATLSLGPWPLPAAGGGYLRHFPFQVIAASVREVKDAGRVGVYYIHPWEVDVDQPRLATSTLTRWRHYGGLRHTAPRLRRLLESAPFTSFRALREERAA